MELKLWNVHTPDLDNAKNTVLLRGTWGEGWPWSETHQSHNAKKGLDGDTPVTETHQKLLQKSLREKLRIQHKLVHWGGR